MVDSLDMSHLSRIILENDYNDAYDDDTVSHGNGNVTVPTWKQLTGFGDSESNEIKR